MPIQPLPESSVRALGSGQVLTDPVSLVKELIENSLDAAATQISVEVSQNLLDSIQVKDNGYGIPELDRDAACVRYCTSKITSFSDISSCRTLGFRGEALASAAELSGSMVLTTRVEGEGVAVACDIGRDGRVKSKKNISAPQGTTVRVTGFLKGLPVRRENSLKNANKFLTKLRALVATYYLSQPRCRISLRILASPQKRGAKGMNEDIIYAPSKSIPEAAQKVIGKEGAANCEWICFPDEEDLANTSESSDIMIKAFLPRPESNLTILSKRPYCTNYIYVDSRPVSGLRGTLKKIVTLSRSYIKPSTVAATVTDPFLYLNILCSRDSYDANVEPAKDDVLFDDSQSILESVEALFKKFYGDPQKKNRLVERESTPKATVPLSNNSSHLRDGEQNTPDTLVIDEDEEELAAQEYFKAIDVNTETAGSADNNQSRAATEAVVDNMELQGSVPTIGHQLNSKPHNTKEGVTLSNVLLPDCSNLERNIEMENRAITDITPATHSPAQTPARKEPRWGFNMSARIEEDDDEVDLRNLDDGLLADLDDTAIEAELAQVRKDVTLSNPWTAAKLASPSRRGQSSPSSHGSPVASTNRSLASRRDEGNSSPPRPINRTPPQKTRMTIYPSPANTQSVRRPGPKHGRLSDPNNAGAMDAFVKRTPRAGATSPVNRSPELSVELNNGADHRRRRFDEDVEAESERSNNGFVSAGRLHRENTARGVIDDSDEDLYAPNIPADRRPSKRRRVETHGDDESTRIVNARAQTTRDPHHNRYLRASAALNKLFSSTPELPRPPEITTEQQEELPSPAADLPEAPRPISRRRRTRTLLPLDAVPPKEDQTCSLSKTLQLMPIYSWRNRHKELRQRDQYCSYSQRTRSHRELFFNSGGHEDNELMGVVENWLRRTGAIEKDGEVSFEMETLEDGMKVVKAREEQE